VSQPKKRIAIVGSGISGIVSAWLLSRQYDITLFEASSRLGGHTHTVPVQDSIGQTLGIDTGFIVFNEPNYPNFLKFMSQLDVPYQDSDMSFGYYKHERPFWYASEFPRGLFSQYRNLFSPAYWHFIFEILKFNRMALTDLASGYCQGITLERYLTNRRFSTHFIDWYLLPMGGAIWSCNSKTILQFPCEAFFQFWKNHDLFNPGTRPTWKTLQGRGLSYLHAFEKRFEGQILRDEPVISIRREQGQVHIITSKQQATFDAVVLATHADISLGLLADPSIEETAALSPWSYSQNTGYLHTDWTIMPPKRSGWASWLCHDGTVTYDLTRLQRLQTPNSFFLTLNDATRIDPSKIIQTLAYTHPIFTLESMATHALFESLNGTQSTYYCGAYQGFGFHEDGVTSALRVANHLGCSW